MDFYFMIDTEEYFSVEKISLLRLKACVQENAHQYGVKMECYNNTSYLQAYIEMIAKIEGCQKKELKLFFKEELQDYIETLENKINKVRNFLND